MTTNFELSWISADGTSDIFSCVRECPEEAEGEIAGFRDTLLGQCGTDDERDAIEAGHFVVVVKLQADNEDRAEWTEVARARYDFGVEIEDGADHLRSLVPSKATYYAISNTAPPVSVRLASADDFADGVMMAAAYGGVETHAEDDLGICAEGMSGAQLAEAIGSESVQTTGDGNWSLYAVELVSNAD